MSRSDAVLPVHRIDIHAAETDHRPADALLVRPDARIAWAVTIDGSTAIAAHALHEALSGWSGTRVSVMVKQEDDVVRSSGRTLSLPRRIRLAPDDRPRNAMTNRSDDPDPSRSPEASEPFGTVPLLPRDAGAGWEVPQGRQQRPNG
jgi:hypothetical protein